MPPGLIRIDTMALPHGATRAYTVVQDGQSIGQVVLMVAKRPHGATLRRLWWAHPPANDPRPIPRPFDTRGAAVSTLRYRHATLNRAHPLDPIDATLSTVRAAYDNAGPTAAVWLAASLTVHHLRELDANRHSNPPSLWRELRRIVAWLQAATGDEQDHLLEGSVHYRQYEECLSTRRAGAPFEAGALAACYGCCDQFSVSCVVAADVTAGAGPVAD